MFCSRVLQRPRSIFPPLPSRPPFSPPQKSFYRFLRDQIITRWCKKEKKKKSFPTSLPPSPSFFLFFSVICVHVASMKRTLRNVSRRREDVVHGTRGKRKENSTRETCARAAWEKKKKEKEERKKEKKEKRKIRVGRETLTNRRRTKAIQISSDAGRPFKHGDAFYGGLCLYAEIGGGAPTRETQETRRYAHKRTHATSLVAITHRLE